MKKLIVAAAIVCVAAVSQAASVMWQATASSTYNGQNIYLLTSISSTYNSMAAFEAAAVDYAQVKKVGATYKVSQRTAEDAAITASSNFYLAVIDSADANTIHYLDVTESFKTYVYEPPASSTGTASAAFASVATSAATATISNVPEPTSGLLLLLGMAGLALKRKRA